MLFGLCVFGLYRVFGMKVFAAAFESEQQEVSLRIVFAVPVGRALEVFACLLEVTLAEPDGALHVFRIASFGYDAAVHR